MQESAYRFLGRDSASVRRHPVFHALSCAANLLVVASVLLLIFGVLWEYSTRCYLQGFVDAVVPYSHSPEQKVEAILRWMNHGPTRQTARSNEFLAARDPEDTLNYESLLDVCGSATNAFVNLAATSGLKSRRLLLLSPDYNTNHVVAEVLIDGRWVIVDPVFHTILKDASGHLLTKAQLADTNVLQDATHDIPGYDPGYSYQYTAHIRLEEIPILGKILRRSLGKLFPSWEEVIDWTLLVERPSYAILIMGLMLVWVNLFLRLVIDRYGRKKWGLKRYVCGNIW